MKKQKIALPDGRYLIYYTFGKSDGRSEKPNPKSQITDQESRGK
jgi:hypothetical protein